MVRAKHLLLAAAYLAAAGMARSQAVWVGATSQSFTDPANWQSGYFPLNDGSEDLEFISGGNAVMNIDGGSPADFAGIIVDQAAETTIIGTNGFTLGADGIALTVGGTSSTSFLTIDVPLTLAATQSWTIHNPGGALKVVGPISGSFAINIDGTSGGSGATVELDSGLSTFTGLTFTGNNATLTIGSGSTGTGDNPTSGPLGIGMVTLGNGTLFNSPLTPANATTIDNTFTIGDGSNAFPVVIGGQGFNNNPLSTVLTFTGTINLAEPTTEIDLGPNSQISFNGTVNGGSGSNLNIGNIGIGNSLLIIRGDVTSVPTLSLVTSASVIFDGYPGSQLTGLGTIVTQNATGATYVGMGSGTDNNNYASPGNEALFIAKLAAPFIGTLGFDTTNNNTFTFDDTVDISAFTSLGFVGLGSATSARLGIDAVINPPGATPAAQTTYPFGGGGGTLTVESPLADGFGARNVNLQAGNAPLTLILNGALSYTGGTSVDGGVLIFDTIPAGPVQLGYGTTNSGYLGNTTNAGYLDTDIANYLLIANVNPSATGGIAIGFDDVTGGTRSIVGATIDLTSLPSNTYIGTSTSVDFDPTTTFVPNGGVYRFAGVKNGYVRVESNLSGSNSVAIGLPKPLESYSLKNGFVTISSVELAGDNSYSGGTVLNSGYLYVGNSNSLGGGGGGALVVPDPNPSYGRSGWIASLNTLQDTPVNLPNDIQLGNNGVALNFGSNSLLTLSGTISDGSGDHGQLGIFGSVDLEGSNTYSGNTTLGDGGYLYVGNNNSLGTGTLSVYPGSTFPTLEVSPLASSVTLSNEISLNGATLNINSPGSVKSLVLNDLITDAGTDGSLILYGYVEFHGANTYSGGTTLSGADARVNNPSSLGSGPITIDSGSTLDAYSTFTLPNDIALNSNMSLVGDSPYEFTLSGNISGTGTITINSPIEFSGNNTYSGGTLFNTGTGALLMVSSSTALGTGSVIVAPESALVINTGVTAANSISLNNGAMIGGYGSIVPSVPGTYDIQTGTAIFGGGGTTGAFSSGVPKPIPGTLSLGSNANLDFGQGGILQFSLDNQFGSPGSDYSAINSAGSLNVSATSGNPFVIQLVAVDPVTKQPGTPTFNNTLASSWVLITATGGITNFNLSSFTVDVDTFGQGNFDVGSFTVTQSGNDLVLNFTPVPEPSTWAMMASGVLGLGAAVRRRRRR